MKNKILILAIILIISNAEAKTFGFMPDHPLYFMEGVSNQVQSMFAFNAEQKINRRLNELEDHATDFEYMKNKGMDTVHKVSQMQETQQIANTAIIQARRQTQINANARLQTVNNKIQARIHENGNVQERNVIQTMQNVQTRLQEVIETNAMQHEQIRTQLKAFEYESRDKYGNKVIKEIPNEIDEVIEIEIMDGEDVIYTIRAQVQNKRVIFGTHQPATAKVHVQYQFIQQVRNQEMSVEQLLQAYQNKQFVVSSKIKPVLWGVAVKNCKNC